MNKVIDQLVEIESIHKQRLELWKQTWQAKIDSMRSLNQRLEAIEEAAGAIVMVAGGIGLPPLLHAMAELAPKCVRCDLYLGAATAAELIEPEGCARATAETGGRFVAATDDGRSVGLQRMSKARRNKQLTFYPITMEQLIYR